MTDFPIFALGLFVMSIVGAAVLAVGRQEVRVLDAQRAPRDRDATKDAG
jgi:hypothetical protein